MRLDLEDPLFWPEIERGSSVFVHKLAVRRRWAKQGVSTALLAFARERALRLGRRYLRLDCVADRAPPRALSAPGARTLRNLRRTP
jgi:GNAT superfamily N-acetyltransferase